MTTLGTRLTARVSCRSIGIVLCNLTDELDAGRRLRLCFRRDSEVVSITFFGVEFFDMPLLGSTGTLMIQNGVASQWDRVQPVSAVIDWGYDPVQRVFGARSVVVDEPQLGQRCR